jgi:lipopolysaccharide transport system permease protein
MQFILFALLIGIFCAKGMKVSFSYWVFITPFLLLQTGLLGLGAGILVSSMTTKYRDFTYLLSFGVTLWMYGTPIVYPLSQVPPKWHWIYILNPMSSIVEVFRYAFLGAGVIKPWQYGIGVGVTCILLTAGIVVFSHIEKTFMDTV